MLEINIKRYFKIIHIVSSVVWHLPREIFDVAMKYLNFLKHTQRILWVELDKSICKFWDVQKAMGCILYVLMKSIWLFIKFLTLSYALQL